MLMAGDEAMIVQSFRRHPNAVLPFIDEYLEGGLATIEKGTAPPTGPPSLVSFRTGVKFAELADRAFSEAIFTEYAANFASWNPAEQASFREGQKLFGEGRKLRKEKPEDALASFRGSFAKAEPLGDFWGMAMAQRAMAETSRALGRMEPAQEAASKASELYGRLQMVKDQVSSLILVGDLRNELNLQDRGVGHYRMALQAMGRSTDQSGRKEVVDKMAAVLEKMGRGDDVKRLLEQEAAQGR